MGLEYHDNLTPELERLAAKLSDTTPVMEAMGQELVSIIQESFDDAALRAAPWPPKKDGSAAT